MRIQDVPIPEPGRTTLMETDWKGYLQVLRALEDRRLRVTFDRGRLEIMSPSEEHEHFKKFLASFLETVMVELEIDYRPGGSMTFKRRDLQRGLEPDECFWVTHWEAVTGKGHYNPRVHPPPDLAVEVEVTRTMLDRVSIYEAMEVPEIWRWTRQGRLRVLCRMAAGTYEERERSPLFPTFTPQQVEQQVRLALDMSTSRWIRAVRSWVKDL